MSEKKTGIAPHGGILINRLADNPDELRERVAGAPQITLSDVSLSDLELIATGVVSPLTGFMDSTTYKSVVEDMHLPNGLPWTIPITLPVASDFADSLAVGSDIALMNSEGVLVGVLELREKFPYDKQLETAQVYGTTEDAHPGVARVMRQGDIYLAGDVWMLELPQPAFPDIYRTPAQTREIFGDRGWRRIVAFQTRNPIHRAHEYIQKCALEIVDGLMLHPLVGETKSDDIPAAVRVECYQVVLEKYFPRDRVLLTSFPAAMRYAGPREAIFHAIARKNYGCTHFIVGRDHAGVGKYYGTYDAQRIFDEFDPALIDITPLMFEHAFFSRSQQQIVTAKTSPHDPSDWMHLSGTQVRELLAAGQPLPAEFTRPEVSEILLRATQEKQKSQ